jgi:hypothetical protein
MLVTLVARTYALTLVARTYAVKVSKCRCGHSVLCMWFKVSDARRLHMPLSFIFEVYFRVRFACALMLVLRRKVRFDARKANRHSVI